MMMPAIIHINDAVKQHGLICMCLKGREAEEGRKKKEGKPALRITLRSFSTSVHSCPLGLPVLSPTVNDQHF